MILRPLIAWILIGAAAALLPSCMSAYQIGQTVPIVLGGAPDTIPPPRGTPEYDAWLAKMAPKQPRLY